MKPYLRSSWRPSFQDIWLAGSESDSAGPLGTTENRLFNSDATAGHEKKRRKREKQKFRTALNAKQESKCNRSRQHNGSKLQST